MGSLDDARGVAAAGLDVGFVCMGWPPDVGGVESHASDLARELAARGHRAHVLCLDSSGEREPYTTADADADGVEVRRMAYRFEDQDSLARMVENGRAEDVVTAWMAETPCDVIHVHHATGFGLGALRAIHEVGAPLVMTLHDYWPLCPRGQMLAADGSVCARPEPEVCGRCLSATFPWLGPTAEAAGERTARALELLALPVRLLAPSEAARSVYAAAGVPPERIRVVRNGIDAEGLAARTAAARAERPPSGSGVRLGVLGSVLPSKGVLELARAFARAAPPGLSLEVHGELAPYHGDATYVDALRALADEAPGLTLHGRYAREELPRILAGLDGVAAPSRWEEVFGLGVREACAAGLPVLVSDAGALPEVAQGGRAGLVVARDDEAAWAEALARFAGDAEARARWRGSPEHVRSARDAALELERLYVEVIVEATGLEPALVHPLEGVEPEAPSAEVAPPPRRGLLGRLFGRGAGRS